MKRSPWVSVTMMSIGGLIGWMASSRSFVPWVPVRGEFDPLSAKWELYHVDKDFTQADNVADRYPEKVRELESIFWAEAEKYNVLPLDWRAVERSPGSPWS